MIAPKHIAATSDGLTARFYINGAEVASGTFTAKATSNEWRIGSYGGSKAGFEGLVDEVRIYDRALSAAAELRTDMETPIDRANGGH